MEAHGCMWNVMVKGKDKECSNYVERRCGILRNESGKMEERVVG